ncbi:MAG: Toprim subdomain protein [Candidatus Methanomethylophilaceae archaeon]|nr:Toprim subdomain protein [Candidatus Methanomethylophilaceae archaeon]
MNDCERLDELTWLLEDLSDISEGSIILIEGRKDREALDFLRITAESIEVQKEGGPLRAAERVYEAGKGAVILTDWDTKGDEIARSLEENLYSLGVRYDTDIRDKLRALCMKDVKDIQSLPSLYRRLESVCGRPPQKRLRSRL